MEDAGGHVIYVGKSRSLRNRVSQYFHGSHDPKTTKMASHVHDFRFVTCDTEMESLALENSLIKQYKPKYNIKLKDAKSYPYIKIDIKSDWPRISMTRKRLSDNSLYFGPYSSTSIVYDAIASIERTLSIPTCKRNFPNDIGRDRPCVYYQIGRCIGVCTGKVSRDDYVSRIESAADILRGGTKDVIRDLTEKMLKASDNLEFEEAAKYRDSIQRMKKLGERQKAVGSPDTECDVIGLSLKEYNTDGVNFRDCLAVFYIRSGYIADSEHFLFGSDEIVPGTVDEDDDGDTPLSSFLMSLYQSREYIPPEIMLSFEIPEHDRALLSDYLTEKAGRRVYIKTPKKGASKYLVDMAVTDAAIHSENSSKQEKNSERTLVNLASLLGLEVLPERIESYDISNLGNEHITCGMVVCSEGKMKKSEYRSFKIQSTDIQDDYASMREAISRRLDHVGIEGDSMKEYPDLFLLDGGKGHVAVIKELLSEKGYSIPVFGMVKDEHHKTRTLTDGVNEINIAKHQDVFRLIYNIQEEVHRYSVGRMTNAKRKTLKKSSLEKIPGIGPKKAKALMKKFGSLTAIRNASLEELSFTPGLNEPDVYAVFEYFNTERKANEK